jgi:hypothetical protein
VTVRLRPDRPRIRRDPIFAVVRRAYQRLVERGARVLVYGCGQDHVHSIIEPGPLAEASLLKGFASMIAKGVNRVSGSAGRALGDRTHVEVLRTPAQAWNAMRYLIRQGPHHGHSPSPWLDRYTSLRAALECGSPFLSMGRSWVWKRLGLVNEGLWRVALTLLARERDDLSGLRAFGVGPPSRRRGEGFAQRWLREGGISASA